MQGNKQVEQLAEELLGRPLCDLGEEEQHVLERLASNNYIGMDADELAAVNISFADRLADRVAKVGGSWSFIIGFGVVLFVWMVLNGPLGAALGIVWDQYPYIFLNLMLSMLAAIQAPVIMMSQNRQSAKDRVAARHDYEVNLRTQLEIARVHRKLDKLFNKMGQLETEVEEVATQPPPAETPAA